MRVDTFGLVGGKAGLILFGGKRCLGDRLFSSTHVC